MADDRAPIESLPAELLVAGGAVRPLSPVEARSSFVADMIPIVDDLRQLNVDFGLRPYRVFLVHGRWTGSRRGIGAEEIIARTEILPTPQVRDMSSIAEVLRPTGLTEDGTVYVDEISARFAEDDLLGRTPDLIDPAQPRTGQRTSEFWWEVQQQVVGGTAALRRFVPAGVPTISKDGFMWTITLTKQDYDRGRDGSTLRTAP